MAGSVIDAWTRLGELLDDRPENKVRGTQGGTSKPLPPTVGSKKGTYGNVPKQKETLPPTITKKESHTGFQSRNSVAAIPKLKFNKSISGSKERTTEKTLPPSITKEVLTMPDEKLNYRSLSIRRQNGQPASLDIKNRSVEIIAATENAVQVFDAERWEMVDEILLIAGAQLPGSMQVPLLDSHQRGDSSSVIGSIRNLQPSNGFILGDAVFSEAPEAAGPWQKVREGHLTDFSAGYAVKDAVWIPEGESQKINGRTYKGPVKIAKEWQLREVSVVPIGADEMATARMKNNNKKHSEGKKIMPEKETKEIFSAEEIRQAERDRMAEISGLCHRFNMPGDLLTAFIDQNVTVENARMAISERVLARAASEPTTNHLPPYTPGGLQGAYIEADASDKRAAAAVDGLCLRAGTKLKEPAPGANEYRAMTLPEIAADCLQASGVNTRGMTKDRIVRDALSARAAATDDFTSILANTGNKVLREAYQQAPSTWRLWCNIGTGADFKEMSRNQLSAAPGLDEVPEHGEYTYGVFTDAKETFSIVKYGKLFAITREALVNDDLGAFTRIPRAFGASAARKVNETAYAVLTANGNMADGIALFHASHSNFIASGAGAAPSEASLNVARSQMRLQTGLAGEILNMAPRFLIHPAALETTVDKILMSFGDLADNKSSGVINPFYQKLVPITEAILDSSSTTGWYLSADPAMADTVEVCFLQGNQDPYLEDRTGWTVDGVEYKCRIDVGCKALDHRSLFFNYGA